MADDRTNRGPQDRSRINLGEDYEVRYWTDKFGVSKRPSARRAPRPRLSRRSCGDRP